MIEFLLPVVPLLFLVGSLLCGRYPGLEAAMSLADRGTGPAGTTHADQSGRQPLRPPARTARGGLLIAFGLAQRPPPLAA